ncbi:hypothetical protein [Bosea sp. (in: a-proteobacteria)]|uniref:hypothetical protein n=1 Tax=Bosea sp. (in: a-proteobacteria) TaxID=1871050 RepID=UPI001210CD78|nr:hypothetical protein [Bosea sp. (in: a-proteobacteria)]TAJ29533.1 MAG: hypothetical protein EPO59_14885 [Bosea sp. (in: a-proteobacteria)]
MRLPSEPAPVRQLLRDNRPGAKTRQGAIAAWNAKVAQGRPQDHRVHRLAVALAAEHQGDVEVLADDREQRVTPERFTEA